jgi:hypothetical protein
MTTFLIRHFLTINFFLHTNVNISVAEPHFFMWLQLQVKFLMRLRLLSYYIASQLFENKPNKVNLLCPQN